MTVPKVLHTEMLGKMSRDVSLVCHEGGGSGQQLDFGPAVLEMAHLWEGVDASMLV